MPYVIHPRVRKLAGRLAAMTCVAMFATTGAAMASCPTQPVSQPFAQFGDTNSYFLAPGGSFEGTPLQVGWNLSNAQLVPGNETYYVNSPTDDQSLKINAGGSATSPNFCLDQTMPSFRFFVQEPALGQALNVSLITHAGPGPRPTIQPLATVADGSVLSWAAWNPVTITANIPAGGSVTANLQFSVPPGMGAWQIDDVYIDPYRIG
jgi:hypothetical protein